MQDPLKYVVGVAGVYFRHCDHSASSFETGFKVLRSAPFTFVQLLDISAVKQFMTNNDSSTAV